MIKMMIYIYNMIYGWPVKKCDFSVHYVKEPEGIWINDENSSTLNKASWEWLITLSNHHLSDVAVQTFGHSSGRIGDTPSLLRSQIRFIDHSSKSWDSHTTAIGSRKTWWFTIGYGGTLFSDKCKGRQYAAKPNLDWKVSEAFSLTLEIMPSQLTWIFTRISPTNLHEPNSPSRKKIDQTHSHQARILQMGANSWYRLIRHYTEMGCGCPVPKLQKWVNPWFPLLRVWHSTCLDVCPWQNSPVPQSDPVSSAPHPWRNMAWVGQIPSFVNFSFRISIRENMFQETQPLFLMINYVPQHVAWINALSHVFRWSHQIEHPTPFLGQATDNFGKIQGHFKLWIYGSSWNMLEPLYPHSPGSPKIGGTVCVSFCRRARLGKNSCRSITGVKLARCRPGWLRDKPLRITKLCRWDSVGFSSMGISGFKNGAYFVGIFLYQMAIDQLECLWFWPRAISERTTWFPPRVLPICPKELWPRAIFGPGRPGFQRWPRHGSFAGEILSLLVGYRLSSSFLVS